MTMNEWQQTGNKETYPLRKRNTYQSGNWADKSVVPQTVYAAPDIDRGPYAKVQIWEEAIRVGSGFVGWRERQLLPWSEEE